MAWQVSGMISDSVDTGILYRYSSEWYESPEAKKHKVNDSLSETEMASLMFVSFLSMYGVTLVNNSSNSFTSILTKFLNPLGSSEDSSFIREW